MLTLACIEGGTVRFDRPEADVIYGAVVQGNWFTQDRVTEKR